MMRKADGMPVPVNTAAAFLKRKLDMICLTVHTGTNFMITMATLFLSHGKSSR